MAVAINFVMLADKLHETPEILVEQENRADISPYLLDTILPLLEQGIYPRLRDIDFAQFEMEDPPRLAEYVQERAHRVYQLSALNQNLCKLSPVCAKTRAFL